MKILWASKNHTGWWIFREVEQWVPTRPRKRSPKSRYLVWENTRLVRARNREEAYRKAVKLAQAGLPSKSKGGECRHAGISLLLPIYEKIEDGAEILWTDRGSMTASRIKKLVKTKRQLPVFNDKSR